MLISHSGERPPGARWEVQGGDRRQKRDRLKQIERNTQCLSMSVCVCLCVFVCVCVTERESEGERERERGQGAERLSQHHHQAPVSAGGEQLLDI